MVKKLCLAIVLCVPFTSSADSYLTGNLLMDMCNSDDSVQVAECYSYLMGVSDTYNVGALAPGHCKPTDQNPEELRDVLLKHMRAHVALWNKPAPKLVAKVLSIAWPCD